jgi:hypothetical protein
VEVSPLKGKFEDTKDKDITVKLQINPKFSLQTIILMHHKSKKKKK